MFRFPTDKNDPIYRRGRQIPEPPPTPGELFRSIGLGLVGFAFMVTVMLGLATILVR